MDLEKIRTCTTDIDSKIGQFKDAIQSTLIGPNAEAKKYYDSIITIKSDYNALKESVLESSNMISAATSGIDTFFNCRIIRSETRNTMGNFCIQFTKYFAIQSVLLAVISALFWILAFCVCCSFKQSKAVRKLKKLNKDKHADSNTFTAATPYTAPIQVPREFNYNTPRQGDMDEGVLVPYRPVNNNGLSNNYNANYNSYQ